MKIVLDTNVLVSGILSPHGPPAAVLRVLLSGRASPCFDERILSEYRDLLSREEFVFDRDLVDELLSFLEATGSPVLASPLSLTLPDPAAQMFVEVAVSGEADFLVTGNLRHFPKAARHSVAVVSPREFIALLSL